MMPHDVTDALRALIVAVETVVEGNPMVAAKTYRNDGKASKHDRCQHGRWMYEGCSDCIDLVLDPALEAARAALGDHIQEK